VYSNSTYHTLAIAGREVTVHTRTDYIDNRSRKKGRVFTSVPREMLDAVPRPSVDDFPHLDLPDIHTRRGEYPEVDKAWDRHNRALVKVWREWTTAALEQVFGEGKVHFSRKAGCACGCSPGFIASQVPWHTDVWVSVKE